MQEDNGQAYRSCELKVSFKSIYQECLERAKEHFAAQPVESVDAPEPEPAQEQPEPLDPRAGYSGEAEEALPEAPEVPEAPRIRGPQLPGATVGDVGADSASESDAEAGPRREGEEREGRCGFEICRPEEVSPRRVDDYGSREHLCGTSSRLPLNSFVERYSCHTLV